MIDFHSHILPCIDDGSRSIEESIALLKMLEKQNVDFVVATPHFYADDVTVSEFKASRQASYEALKKNLSSEKIKIILGAEVRYYQGISRMPELNSLCIEGSKLLLLEMPMSNWTEYALRELVYLNSSRDLTIILAHIDRYLNLQNKNIWYRLLDNNILMQANATFFTNLRTRRKSLQMLKDHYIHVIGSDCHNLSLRPPQIGKAIEIIKKRLGEDFLNKVTKYGHSILSDI